MVRRSRAPEIRDRPPLVFEHRANSFSAHMPWTAVHHFPCLPARAMSQCRAHHNSRHGITRAARVQQGVQGSYHVMIVSCLWFPKQADNLAAHRCTTVYLDHFRVERSSFSGGLFEYCSPTRIYLIHSSRYLFYQWPSRVSTRR